MTEHLITESTTSLNADVVADGRFDVFSRLLKDRIIVLGTDVNDEVANYISAQMLFLESQDSEKPIWLYINSPGGSVTSGMAIYDTMQILSCPVATYCVGQAASGAAVLLAGGSEGKRYALPHSRVMLHQPYGGVNGQISDIEIQANEILRNRQMLNDILAQHTDKKVKQIEKDTDRDFFLTAEEAQEYGVVDEILSKPPIDPDATE